MSETPVEKLHRSQKKYITLYNEFIDMILWFKKIINYDDKYRNNPTNIHKINRDHFNLLFFNHLLNIDALLPPMKRKYESEKWIILYAYNKKILDNTLLLDDSILDLRIDDLNVLNNTLEFLINFKTFTLVDEKINYDIEIRLNGKKRKLKL